MQAAACSAGCTGVRLRAMCAHCSVYVLVTLEGVAWTDGTFQCFKQHHTYSESCISSLELNTSGFLPSLLMIPSDWLSSALLCV